MNTARTCEHDTDTIYLCDDPATIVLRFTYPDTNFSRVSGRRVEASFATCDFHSASSWRRFSSFRPRRESVK